MIVDPAQHVGEIKAVWPNIHVSDDSLFKCIREIRAALGDDQRQLIKLVSGRGYLFDAEISSEKAGLATGAAAEPGVPARLFSRRPDESSGRRSRPGCRDH